MRKQRSTIILLILVVVLILSACEDADAELLGEIASVWLAENEILSPEEKLNVLGLADELLNETMAEISRENEAIILDGLTSVIDDIEDADMWSNKALATGDTVYIQKAIDLRPEDWRYREDAVALWIAEGNESAANEQATKADQIIIDAIEHGWDCPTLRLEQLIRRRDALKRAPTDSDGDILYTSRLIESIESEISSLVHGQLEGTFCDPDYLTRPQGLPGS
jgi:hypothetical protein